MTDCSIEIGSLYKFKADCFEMFVPFVILDYLPVLGVRLGGFRPVWNIFGIDIHGTRVEFNVSLDQIEKIA